VVKYTSVGIREAKANLSRLLKDVQEGAEIILTDRGNPVARLVPVEPVNLTLQQRIAILQKGGIVEPAQEASREVTPVSAAEGVAQKILREDRDS
jgi:prevent-host-death family protein